MCANAPRPWFVSALFAVSLACAQPPLTVLLEFDRTAIGAARPCDGEFRVDAGDLRLRPWLDDGQDAVEGLRYRLTTPHDEASAKAAGLPSAQRATLAKGLLLELNCPPEAVLAATSVLGPFEVPLRRLREEPVVAVLDGKVRLQRLPPVVRLGGDQAEEEYPSVAVLPDGTPAVAFVAWDGTGDRLVLRTGEQTSLLTEKAGDLLDPRCAVDGKGTLWTVWAAGQDGQWDLFAAAGERRVRLTRTPLNDFWPRLARDPLGQLWLAWQTVAEDLHYEVMVGRLSEDGLTQITNVSEHPHDDWEPAVCATPDGRLVVAWDTYRNGSYDVYLREFAVRAAAIEPLGAVRPVAASAQREAHATVAADSAGRVWLAWDVSVADWGKHPARPASLHSNRQVEVACLAQGRLQRPAAGLQASLPQGSRKYCEYPQVAVDGRNSVWVVFRFENEVLAFYKDPKTNRNVQSYGLWHLFATRYDGRAWTTPQLLADSNGRQDMRPDVARAPTGDLLVAFGADARTRRLPYVPVDYDVFLASLDAAAAPPPEAALVDAPDLGQVTPAAPDPELEPLPRTWSVGGSTYHLLLGDTHRHTDISRCSNGRDGSLQDAYRYALDASGLDWLAISDHDQDILKHRADRLARPRQDYDWWRSQKCCDLYSIPGRFVALYGYEHGGSYGERGGHKNIVMDRRGLPVQEADAPQALFAALADSGALAIPHQLADGGSRADWAKWSPEYERVAEIFQTRGSYEFEGCPRAAAIFTPGNSLWDALARGVRIGIIASSDHGQTHQARAGVYVPTGTADATTPRRWTRESILEALRARRAFGATVAAAMQVAANGQPMGQELTLGKPPTLAVSVAAASPITRIEVIRERRFVYSTEPNGPTASFQYTDADPQTGASTYYYVRARIGANDYAWSSPVWVTRAP
jgi:hypothetical protein